jgi:hypothetical protein
MFVDENGVLKTGLAFEIKRLMWNVERARLQPKYTTNEVQISS